MKRIVRKAALPAALVMGLGGAATLLDAVQDPVATLGAQAAPLVGPGPEDLASAFRTASKAALPGVVYVEVESAPRAIAQSVPDQFRGTPFEQFFGAPGRSPRQQAPRMGSGSGFIISPDGYILTNNHVVEDAQRVTVTLTDKREFLAEVVGRDPNTDVAVLKVDGEKLPTVKLGTAENLQVGDWVLALGYPMSLGETVTAGIVSAMGKSINILAEAEAPIEHFIQTDAAINPGNSGGPLINLRGEVVGINTAIASPTGAYSGYGFSVPIHLAKRVADDLIRYGTVHRPKLGVQIKEVQPADVEVFGLPSAEGAVVAVLPEGPAKDAGVRLGDVIVAVNGEPVADMGELMEEVALLQPGDRAVLGLIRYGKRTSATVTLGSFATEPAPRSETSAAREADAVARLGIAAEEVTPAIARELGFERAEGVVVSGVDPMGPAAQSGLTRGVRIDRLNGADIRSLADLRRAAAALKPGDTVSILARIPTGEQTIVNFRLQG